MAYTVGNLKQDLTGMAHGTTLNQVQGLNQLIYRAGRKVLLDVDLQETIRFLPFASPIFDSVYDYALAPDVKGNAIIDIQPQGNRPSAQVFGQTFEQQFSLGTSNAGQVPQFYINFHNGVKTIQINNPFSTPQIFINTASGTTINGTWNVDGTATDLTTDNVNWIVGGGSLKFNLAAGANPSTGGVNTTTQAAVNLTEQLNQSTLFVWVYMPTGSAFTSVRLRWGSSNAAYYQQTATLTQQNTAFADGWNLIAMPWNDTTTIVGSPDVSSITFVEVDLTYNGTLQTGVRVNDVTCQTGQILNYYYYSKYLFRDSITGAFKEQPTDDSDIINLDVESYNMLTYQCGYLLSQQVQGKNALLYDKTFFETEYTNAMTKYKLRYKSQIQKPQVIYYKLPRPQGWIGTRAWWPM
jgi:hypothetical protein